MQGRLNETAWHFRSQFEFQTISHLCILVIFTVSPPLTALAQDIKPPSVSITAPSDGITICEPGGVTITAQATDDVGVSRVEFSDNGGFPYTRYSSPYTVDWFVSRGQNGPHTWKATAFDAAGNSSSSEITLTVDIGPHVEMTSPPSGSTY